MRMDTLRVDGGVTNSDLAMQLQANVSDAFPFAAWMSIMSLSDLSF